MIHVTANTPNNTWRSTFTSLYDNGTETGNDRYFRDEVVLIEIENPIVEPADPRFPMKQEDLDVITRFIYTGENEDKVIHDWTKLYYHRAFDEPNSQIEFLIGKLDPEYPAGEAQISIKARKSHRVHRSFGRESSTANSNFIFMLIHLMRTRSSL